MFYNAFFSFQLVFIFLSVKVKNCLKHAEFIRSSDPNFMVLKDGSLYTTNAVSLPSRENTITVHLIGNHEHEQKKILVSLLTHPKKVDTL